MDEHDALDDVRFLREVVERTQRPSVNDFWAVTLGWGCVVTVGYVISAVLGMEGKVVLLRWLWPILIYLVALPLHWYLVRRARAGIVERGVRPGFRKDLLCLWLSISAVGLLWTAGLGFSGNMTSHWYVLPFAWGSLYVIGYVMNGILISKEWFWAAGVQFASLIAAFLAGPHYYWLPGVWIGGTLVLAGLLGRRNVRLQAASA